MRSSGNTENTLLSFFLTATVFLVTIVGIEVWMELQGKRLSLEGEIKPIREMVMPADKQGPLSLKSEHFEVKNTNPGRFESTVRNEVRDNADTRERSNEGSTSKPFNTSDRGDAKDADQTVRELEAQLLNNSGGAAERAKIEARRAALNQRMHEIFQEADFVITASNPDVAFNAEGPLPSDFGGLPGGMGNNGKLTFPANMYGNPAISIPSGLVDGLPVALQINGRHFSEQLLLELGLAMERSRPWALVAPNSPI